MKRLLFAIMILSFATVATSVLAANRPAPVDPDIGRGSPPAVARSGGDGGTRIPADIQNLNTSEYFATIQDAIDDTDTVDGHVLEVQVASHSEGIVNVSKQVTIQGAGGGASILATTDTGTSGDARGWFLMTVPGVTFDNLSFDGNGFDIVQGLRFKEDGTVTNCSFTEIKAPSYNGLAIVGFKNTTVSDCTFSQIGRIGIILFSADVTAGLVERINYTGKGDGDWLDYGIELGGGAVATLNDNTVTNCTGVALSDGSTSAGILITTYYGAGTAGTLNGNFATGNTGGLAVGYDASDVSLVVAADNDLSGNTDYGLDNTSSTETVDASANWWGSNDPTAVAASIGGLVDYTPWLDVGTDTDLGTAGFQGDFSVLWVDDDSPQTGTTGRVQEGVDLVTASTVHILPGTYEEQIVVTTNNLSLSGAGTAATTILSPVAMTEFFTTSADNYPIIFINGATGVGISDLTVDGAGRGNGNYRFIGVGFWNGDGSVTSCEIVGVQDTPFSGAQHGVGIYSYNNGGGPYSIDVTDTPVYDFQKTGIALSGDNLTVSVTGCTVTGAGPTAVTAQNGIQVSYGTGGSISGCDVSGVAYTGGTWTATGYLIYGGGTVDLLNGCVSTSNQTGYYNYDTDGSIDGSSFSGGEYGILFYNTTTAAAGRLPRAQARPFDPMEGSGAGGDRATMAVSVSGCDVDGEGSGDVGIWPFTDGGTLTTTLTDNDVHGWDYGVIIGSDYAGDDPVATVYGNRFFQNTQNAQDDGAAGNAWSLVTLPCTGNFWDDFMTNTGYPTQYDIPGTPGGVDTCPTVTAFSISGGPPVISCSASATLTVTLDDVASMRGYDVLFEYDDTEWNNPTVTQLLDLDSYGDANDFFMSFELEPGKWTISHAIIGSTTGFSTTTPVDLFEITMTPKAAAADLCDRMLTLGTTYNGADYPKLRDIDNSPLANAITSGAGDVAIDVDCTAPTVTSVTSGGGPCWTGAPGLLVSGTEGPNPCGEVDKLQYQYQTETAPCDPGGTWLDLATGLNLPGPTWGPVGAYTPGTTPGTPGNYTVYVRAVDEAGNVTGSCVDVAGYNFDYNPTVPTVMVTGLSAAPGHRKVTLTWTNPTLTGAEEVVIVRKRYNGYPSYAGQAGYAYPTMADGTDGDVILTTTTATSYVDLFGSGDQPIGERDIYLYRAFVVSCAGEYGGLANPATLGSDLTSEDTSDNRDAATNYWLGDLSDATPSFGGPYDGYVLASDLTIFSGEFGLAVPPGNAEADFGPTKMPVYSATGVPTPDGIVDFEDIIILAINYNTVAPVQGDPPEMIAQDEPKQGTVHLEIGPIASIIRAGQTVIVPVALMGQVDGVQGVRTVIDYDASLLVFESGEVAPKIEEVPHFFMALPEAGRVDLNLALMGNEEALRREGVVFLARFRALRDGPVALQLVGSKVRDIANRELLPQEGPESLSWSTHENPNVPGLPTDFRLGEAHPNPFNPRTMITFDLPAASIVRLTIYDVAGRVVRTVVSGSLAAGRHVAEWDGTDDAGRSVQSGIYFYELDAGGFHSQKRMTLLK